VKRKELKELHYITPISNVPSILTNGILSHTKAQDVHHESCASTDIQSRRMRVIVPGGRPLHHYVNLYFNARNPMMHVLKDKHHNLSVLAISPSIVEHPGVIITDRNAAREMVLFKSGTDGLALIDRERVYAEDWSHPNPIEKYEHKGRMCAEVLVPDEIAKQYILKIYVSSSKSKDELTDICGTAARGLPLVINGHLFFQ